MSAEPGAKPADVVPLFKGAAELAQRPDDELVLLARGGRREAFDALVRRHQQLALRLASRCLGDSSLAADAAQNAFLALYRGLDRYVPQGRFPFFLSRLVLNQCRMLGRAAGSRQSASDRFSSDPGQAAAQAMPDDLLLAQERRRDTDRALQRLSDKLREVLVLRYTAGYPLEQIAAILDLPLGTVKSRLFAGLERLRAELGANP